MNNTPPYIICDESITMVIAGKPYTMNASNASFNDLKARIKNEDFKDIEELFDTGKTVGIFTNGNIVVQDNSVLYKGHVVNNHVVDRILTFMREGLPYKPLVAFLDNLMANPSYRAVQELYGFLEASSLPITEDGCFLAFRKVTSDFKDYYSGKFDNSVGSIVEIPRNLVDEDKDKTCSSGLHFCSRSYLPMYYGGQGKTVIVKINPADVVAIPTDYNNAKGRCCKYSVVSECEGHDEGQDFGPLHQDSSDEDGDNSYDLGYNFGYRDADLEELCNAEDALVTSQDGSIDDELFADGYHHGYSDSVNNSSTTPCPKAVKRDAKGRFV